MQDRLKTESTSKVSSLLSLFFLSVLILFLEMMLIRWIGTEIRIFAYIQSSILVTCFLALGMGCIRSEYPKSISSMLVPLTFLVGLITLPLTKSLFPLISIWLSSIGDINIWYKGEISSKSQAFLSIGGGLFSCFGIMLFIWDIFLPLGSMLGSAFEKCSDSVKAYSVNIAGSLVGTWLFAGVSFLGGGPGLWIVVLVVLSLTTAGGVIVRNNLSRLLIFALLLCASVQAFRAEGIREVWTPYQKLVLEPYEKSPGGLLLNVNNVGYQLLLDLSDKNVRNNPEVFGPEPRLPSHYDFPFLLQPNPQRVLILGAGAGNDVAGAIRNGAKQVTAVDIDPAIISLGKAFHPERPYQDPGVEVVIDDARAYLTRPNEKFDLIIFGLLDAHTSTALTNVRLDHYMYTLESFRRVQQLLKKDGVFVLSFGMGSEFIVNRIRTMIQSTFNQDPIIFNSGTREAFGYGGVMFAVGNSDTIATRLAKNDALSNIIQPIKVSIESKSLKLSTDDWPYLYLEHARIPTLYLLIGFLLIGLFFYRSGSLQVGNILAVNNAKNWHFFFLGAAFLLLEVQAISRGALWLGNTWLVSAIIVSAIMIFILFANLVSERVKRIPLTLVYSILIATCLGLSMSRLEFLYSLPVLQRAIAVGLVLSMPVFFSGLAFVKAFKRSSKRSFSLGWNLFGALLGALLQSVSFVTGQNSLLFLVAVFYLLAFLTREHKGASIE